MKVLCCRVLLASPTHPKFLSNKKKLVWISFVLPFLLIFGMRLIWFGLLQDVQCRLGGGWGRTTLNTILLSLLPFLCLSLSHYFLCSLVKIGQGPYEAALKREDNPAWPPCPLSLFFFPIAILFGMALVSIDADPFSLWYMICALYWLKKARTSQWRLVLMDMVGMSTKVCWLGIGSCVN